MLAQVATRSYQQNNIMTSDPIKLILLVYDRAIAGCRQQELKIAGRAITELISGLNMDAAPIAGKLLAVYQYCGELCRKGQYDKAVEILQELRDTWAEASGKVNSPKTDL